MTKRSVVRLDNKLLKPYSVRIPVGAGEIENGFIAKLSEVEKGNLDVRGITAPAAGDSIVIIAEDAIVYDNNRVGTGMENEFFMKEGQVVRAYKPEENNLVSVSLEGFATEPSEGDLVGANGSYKLDVVVGAPATGTYFKVVKLESVGGALAVNATQSATVYAVLETIRA